MSVQPREFWCINERVTQLPRNSNLALCLPRLIVNMWGCCSVGERRKLELRSETTLLLGSCTPQTQLNPCPRRGNRVCRCGYGRNDTTNCSWRIWILHCHKHCPSHAHRHGQWSNPLARRWWVSNSLQFPLSLLINKSADHLNVLDSILGQLVFMSKFESLCP